jgi:hypothetical protein
MLSQNDSVAVDFKEFTLPVDDTSVAGRAALTGKPINVAGHRGRPLRRLAASRTTAVSTTRSGTTPARC